MDFNKYWDSSRDDYSDRPTILFQDEHLFYLRDCKEILDLGCGNGNLVRKLNELGYTAHGVTYNQLEVKNRLHENVEYGDMQDLHFDNESFDGFIMWDSLEHCQSAYIALCEAKRVLREGGKGLIFMPGANWSDCHVHICCYLPYQMEQLFKQSGLKLINVHEKNYPDGRSGQGMAIYEIIKDSTYKPKFSC